MSAPRKWSDYQKSRMVAMYRDGMPLAEIAEEFETTRDAITSILRTKTKMDRRKRMAAAKAPVPAWVPKDLHSEYRRICREKDETAAAAWARREKAA